MKPPEFYGILALGHLADIEARRLMDKLDSGKEQDRKNVAIYSIVMAKIYHEHLHKLKDMPSYDIAESEMTTCVFAYSYPSADATLPQALRLLRATRKH